MDLDFFAPTGEMIKEYLDLNKMTKEELAQKLDISDSFMDKIMDGTFPLTDEMAEEISKIFKIESSYFIDYEKSYREFLSKKGK